MNRDQIEQIVFDSLTVINHARPDDSQIPVTSDTLLFGKEGNLDSMGLVSLLLDIEDALLDQDIEVTLSDERAMSQTRSPFRSVDTLTDYIAELLSSS